LLESVNGIISSDEIIFDQLLIGMNIDVYGVYGEDENSSCLTAEVVLVTAAP
jgi:hypothetical protein